MKPWEQQPDESRQAYAAFCAYRDLGPERSQDSAYRLSHPHAKVAPGCWARWMTAYRWYERVTAYDAYLEGEARKKVEADTIKRRAEMLKRHRQAGELLTGRGMEHLTKSKITKATEAIAAIKAGVELERQAEGMPSWVVEILNADEDTLERRRAELLDARQRARAACDRDSAGDAAAVAANGKEH